MPAAKAVADRRPGNCPKPDSVSRRVAVAIGFDPAGNHADPRPEPTAWIKPESEPDVRLHLEPKSETDPKDHPEADAKTVANPNVESLPDLRLCGVPQRLAEHGPAGGRLNHDHRHSFHAQQVGDHYLLQGRHHSGLHENVDCRLRR